MTHGISDRVNFSLQPGRGQYQPGGENQQHNQYQGQIEPINFARTRLLFRGHEGIIRLKVRRGKHNPPGEYQSIEGTSLVFPAKCEFHIDMFFLNEIALEQITLPNSLIAEVKNITFVTEY